jgi:hypothetical protein
VRRDGVEGIPAALEVDVTVGEMMNTLKCVYGGYDGGPEM